MMCYGVVTQFVSIFRQAFHNSRVGDFGADRGAPDHEKRACVAILFHDVEDFYQGVSGKTVVDRDDEIRQDRGDGMEDI